MIADITTVMWKERKGLLRQGGNRPRAMLGLLVPVIMVAVILPVQLGREMLDGSMTLLVSSAVVPFLLVGTMIPESFAGERERHTLETLLASRLLDRAILFGKVGLAVGYGWGMMMLLLLLSLVVVNVVHWDGHVMLYKPDVILANVTASLLMASLVAGLGVLISLRSATAQGAQQALMAVLVAPIILLQFSVVMFRDQTSEILKTLEGPQVITIIVVVLVVLDLAMFAAAMARFQRARLMLD